MGELVCESGLSALSAHLHVEWVDVVCLADARSMWLMGTDGWMVQNDRNKVLMCQRHEHVLVFERVVANQCT